MSYYTPPKPIRARKRKATPKPKQPTKKEKAAALFQLKIRWMAKGALILLLVEVFMIILWQGIQ